MKFFKSFKNALLLAGSNKDPLFEKPAKKRKPKIKKLDDYYVFEQALLSLNIQFQKEVLIKKLIADPIYKRGFRLDYLIYKDKMPFIALEIEGGLFTGSRHTTGVGFNNDILKYNALTFLNLPLIRFNSLWVKSEPVVCADFILYLLKKTKTVEPLVFFTEKFFIKRAVKRTVKPKIRKQKKRIT